MKHLIRVDVSRLALARLGVGLAQGMALYLLYHAAEAATWPTTSAFVFAPALLIAIFLPVVVLLGLGTMRAGRLAAWSAIIAIVIAGLGAYDIWRRGDVLTIDFSLLFPFAAKTAGVAAPTDVLALWAFVSLFIAHSLITAGDIDRKPIARYSTYFDTSWRYAVQGILAAIFTLLFWFLLHLGTSLFKMINIEGPSRLIEHSWFNIPITALTFAYAIHIVDTRSSLVRNVRMLKLTLLSWLLPLITLITTAFLLSLPFTGLEPLWNTRRATVLLLTASAALIVLINAAYQDGTEDRAAPTILRWSGRLAALALLPLVAISTYALALRVGQYGWTTSRIVVAGELAVAWIFAVGYLWSVAHRAWLKPIEYTNVVAAFAALAVILVLLSPLADPTRIAVSSQMARLLDNKVEAAKFDFVYLRWDAVRFGRAALSALASNEAVSAEARQDVATVLKMEKRPLSNWKALPPEDRVANITAYPTGRQLPASFTSQQWQGGASPLCLSQRAHRCEAFFVDVDGDGVDEIALIPVREPTSDGNRVAWASVFRQGPTGTWNNYGMFTTPCENIRELMRAGQFTTAVSTVRDISVGGLALHVSGPVPECPAAAK